MPQLCLKGALLSNLQKGTVWPNRALAVVLGCVIVTICEVLVTIQQSCTATNPRRRWRRARKKSSSKVRLRIFQNWGNMNSQTQKAWHKPSKINKKKSTPGYILVKLKNTKDKGKILKVIWKNNPQITGRSFTAIREARKQWNNIFKALTENSCQLTPLAQLSFNHKSKTKTFMANKSCNHH